MDVVAEFKAQNPSLFSRGSAIPVTYNKTKSNALAVPRARTMSANSAKRGVSLSLPAGFINGSHNLLASLNFQPSAPVSATVTRFSPSEEVTEIQDKNGKLGQGLGVQGNSSENTTTFSYPRSGSNRPLPQLKSTDNSFTANIKPVDGSVGQDASKNGSAFTAPSAGSGLQHQPVVLLNRPLSAISTVNIHDRTLSSINRVNREREPVRQSSPLTIASLSNSNNKHAVDTVSTDNKEKDNSELDNFLMLAEKDNKPSLLAHSSSSVSTQLNSASTLPLPSMQSMQNSSSLRIIKRVRFSEHLVAFEPNQNRGRSLAEAPSRVARSTSSSAAAAEVKPILKYTTQLSSITGIGNRNGQQQHQLQQLHLQQQTQTLQQQQVAAASQHTQQQNQPISLKNPAALNGNNNANINSNYLNSSPISTTINTINTMNNTLSNKNLTTTTNNDQQQRPSTTQSMMHNRSQSMKMTTTMPVFNPRDSLTHKSVEMIRRGMAGIAYNNINSSGNNDSSLFSDEQASAMGMEEIKFDVNGNSNSNNGVSRSSPITWESENTSTSSLKTGAAAASDEKKKANTGSSFPRFDMGKRRPKSASFSAAADSSSNNGLASLLTVSSNGNPSSSYANNSYSSNGNGNGSSESIILFSLPAKAFSIGTMSCRAASPVQFYPSYMQFSFQPPFESSGRSIMIAYIDIQGMTLIGTKFRFKAPQRVLEDNSSGNSSSGMNGEKNYVLLEFMSTMQIAILREKVIPMILEGQQQQQQSQQPTR